MAKWMCKLHAVLVSDGILKHNRTKTFPLAGKAVGNGIHNPCNWQIFPCALSTF